MAARPWHRQPGNADASKLRVEQDGALCGLARNATDMRAGRMRLVAECRACQAKSLFRPSGPQCHQCHLCRANQGQARSLFNILGSKRHTTTAARARQASVAFLNVDGIFNGGPALAITKLRDAAVVKLSMRMSGFRAWTRATRPTPAHTGHTRRRRRRRRRPRHFRRRTDQRPPPHRATSVCAMTTQPFQPPCRAHKNRTKLIANANTTP